MKRDLWNRAFILNINCLITCCAAAATNASSFWGTYYSSCVTTKCLVPITNSAGCELNDNSCVCTTSSYVSAVATCLGQQCPTDVLGTYTLYNDACVGNGGYTLAISKTQFLIDSGTLSSFLNTNFWSTYADCPKNDCLVPLTASSGCEIDDNACVCQNSTLVKQIASCVGKSCTAADVTAIYTQYSGNCAAAGGYSLTLSESDWLSAAGTGSESSSTESTSAAASIALNSMLSSASSINLFTTSASTPSTALYGTPVRTDVASNPTATNSGSSGGLSLSKDQQINIGIGVGVGLGVGIPTIIIGIMGLRHNRRMRIASQVNTSP